jgi:co-chaperonin GroES (HSP10)
MVQVDGLVIFQMKLKPLANNILISPLPVATVTSGGIHLVDRYNDDRMQWKVEAVGPKVQEIVPGDCVLTPLHFDHLTLDDGRKVVNASQVLMVWGNAYENKTDEIKGESQS